MTRLHLGCGENYLKGYVNIDFPPTKHTIQKSSIADKYADLKTLRYPAKSVNEIRLHHTFEHFIRSEAIALFASWHSWLKPGGKIHIEVPDFDATSKLILKFLTKDHDKKVAIRHIFGSNEAEWATHYDGWSAKRLEEICKLFGFQVLEMNKSAYLSTKNITVIAKKVGPSQKKDILIEKARGYLLGFCVDDSEIEQRLLDVWMKQFKNQLQKTLAT